MKIALYRHRLATGRYVYTYLLVRDDNITHAHLHLCLFEELLAELPVALVRVTRVVTSLHAAFDGLAELLKQAFSKKRRDLGTVERPIVHSPGGNSESLPRSKTEPSSLRW